jgi:hypothetical protein
MVAKPPALVGRRSLMIGFRAVTRLFPPSSSGGGKQTYVDYRDLTHPRKPHLGTHHAQSRTAQARDDTGAAPPCEAQEPAGTIVAAPAALDGQQSVIIGLFVDVTALSFPHLAEGQADLRRLHRTCARLDAQL